MAKKKVRMGLIGCGNIGRLHMNNFPDIDGLECTAVCDIDPEALEAAVEKTGAKGFDNAEKMMDCGLVDAILIATPHYDHPPLSLAAFKRNIHVLTEKPVGVTAKAAALVNAAHAKKKKLTYAAMFQSRLSPTWRKVKEILDNGELGKIRRINWIVTYWFRTQTYYNSGGWRATWKGEGGGVLINQCPHNLDLMYWLFGMPVKVTGNVGLGKYHDIEVEDDVTALLEYENGATGVFITTTGDAPGTNRLEITGENGKLVVDGDKPIVFEKTKMPVGKFCQTCPDSFQQVEYDRITIEPGGTDGRHKGILQNFVNNIRKNEKLIAPAEEGLYGLELGNAMLMAGLTDKSVPVPTDRDAFERLIKKLIRQSKGTKKVVKKTAVDMGASFSKGT